MKITTAIAALFLCTGFLSCSDGSEESVLSREISLKGAVGTSSTRAVINSGYTEELKVCFARRDKKSTGGWSNWSRCPAVLGGGGGERPIIFNPIQLYSSDGSRTELQGYYPAEAVWQPDNAGAVFTIDGVTDVMATDPVGGSIRQPFPLCRFHHLLTQLQIVCFATKPADWGEVLKIEVEDVCTSQYLAFGEDTPVLRDNKEDESSVRNLPVSGIDGLELPPVAPSDNEIHGYALLPVTCCPATEDKPLSLLVTTSRDGRGKSGQTTTRTLIWLKDGFQVGHIHRILLRFGEEATLEVVEVDVAPWQERDEGEIPL